MCSLSLISQLNPKIASENLMNGYDDLPNKAFWRSAVADNSMYDVAGLWDPKFKILPNHAVATYGSCFAQHIGRALTSRGFNWLSTEQAPAGMGAESKVAYNYDIFTSRTGNIYTTSLLVQWLQWAFGISEVPEEIWEKNRRYFDPFRPGIEPGGFASIEELRASQQQTIKSFRDSILGANLLFFTLGLTERWKNVLHDFEYPLCPGVVAGTFDVNVHKYENMEYSGVREALSAALKIMRKHNPELRVILTVSPVPLTATKSGKHVLIATMQSKSILRAVAGQISDRRQYVDYFPSYEIINSPVFRGSFFEPNQRNVTKHGVRFVMDTFFHELEEKFGEPQTTTDAQQIQQIAEELVCEDELLAAFATGVK